MNYLSPTRHARVRQQQRSIPPIMLDLLAQFGREEKAPGGAVRSSFDNRGWRNVEAYLGPAAKHFAHLRDTYLVEAQGVVLTVARDMRR